jgi:hypothetical protein
MADFSTVLQARQHRWIEDRTSTMAAVALVLLCPYMSAIMLCVVVSLFHRDRARRRDAERILARLLDAWPLARPRWIRLVRGGPASAAAGDRVSGGDSPLFGVRDA